MSSDPTPAMIERCQAWLKVIDTLKTYLLAAAQRYDWISDSTGQISREMPQPEDLGDQFAPTGSGGIKDLFKRLWWDLNLPDGKCASDASVVIKTKLLVDLDSLKQDLDTAIADFTKLGVSFGSSSASNIAPEASNASYSNTKVEQRIERYVSAVSQAESGKQPAMDPFLIKMSLDKQLNNSLRRLQLGGSENAQYAADAAKKLDGAVVERLQAILKEYVTIAEGNGKIIAEGARQVGHVFVNQPKLSEYKHWLQSSKYPGATPLSSKKSPKTTVPSGSKGPSYPKEDSPYARAIRTGTLERRTRILRNYSASDYILTPLSLIEMRAGRPVWSIDLLDASLVDKNVDEDHFVIRARQHDSSSGKQHNWMFRAKVAANWKRDLKALLSGSMPESLGSLYARREPKAVTAPAEEPVKGVTLKETGADLEANQGADHGADSDSEVSSVEHSVYNKE